MDRMKLISIKLIVILILFFSLGAGSMSDSNLLDSKPEKGPVDNPAYQRLKNTLDTYKKIADQGGWERIPEDGSIIKKGDTSDIIPSVRKRLVITGDLSSKAQQSGNNEYDEKLQKAVKKFQRRHAIVEDGIIGPNTIREMNVPVEQKISQIEYSLDVWKNLPDTLGEKYVFVNIPEFRLRTYKNQKEDLSMKIIVGKEYGGETPTFSDSVEYIIINPYWNIPKSIVLEEILPQARKDHGYLYRNDYEIVSHFGNDAKVYQVTSANLDRVENGNLHLRQKPGPNNSLGLIKFMFPNKYSIYLHGTPADHLFERVDRTFSHGCIRVEKPIELGEFLLENAEGNWSKDKIVKETENGKWKQVNMEQKIPVYITYLPVFVEEDNTVVFSKDIYDRSVTARK